MGPVPEGPFIQPISFNMALKNLSFIFLLFLFFSCKSEKGSKDQGVLDRVLFDTLFPSARLNKVQKIGEHRYTAYVLPSFEPVNQSPWFAFGLRATEKKQIELVLDYGPHKHRYVPKLSTDRVDWKPMDSSKVKIDSLQGRATLFLDVSPKKLYVAAQEIETPQDTYRWMDGLLDRSLEIKKQLAGKTVLDNHNYVLSHESVGSNHAVVLVARQHPPEIPGGTIGFKSFYETLFSDSPEAQRFRNHFNIYAFPLLNPDGVSMGNWRHNAKGVDLNRDWVDFTQPETRAVRRFLNAKAGEGKKFVFAIDFHTSYSGPYLLVLDSINETKTSRITPQWLANIEATSEFEANPRRRNQDLPYCYNYFFNEWGSEAVTYEDGDEVDREIIRKRAQVYARELMKTLLNKKKDGSLTN